ncbi:MAG: hypothetical protein ABI353_13695 [Isosphaeraceae bacterium]
MDTNALAALTERLDRLEQENQRLHRANQRWRRTGLSITAALVVLLVVAPIRPLAILAQRPGPAQGERPFPPPPPPEPIRLGLGIKIIEAEHYLLRDQNGNLLASLAVGQDGTPILGLHAKDQAARIFMRVSPDGEPGIVFFDEHGQHPVELVVTRTGAPALKVLNRDDKPLFGHGRPHD